MRAATVTVDPSLDLGAGVRVHGPYLLVEGSANVIVAWRGWQVLTPAQVDGDLEAPARWRSSGERHRLPSGHVLWLTRRAGYLSWFGGKVERHSDGSIDDSSNINGGLLFKVFVSAQHRRKGVASAMLAMARAAHPDLHIRHSKALTPDGAAWALATP